MDEIMGRHNFNFALKVPQMCNFLPKFCIFGRQYSDKKKIGNFLMD